MFLVEAGLTTKQKYHFTFFNASEIVGKDDDKIDTSSE